MVRELREDCRRRDAAEEPPILMNEEEPSAAQRVRDVARRAEQSDCRHIIAVDGGRFRVRGEHRDDGSEDDNVDELRMHARAWVGGRGVRREEAIRSACWVSVRAPPVCVCACVRVRRRGRAPSQR